MKTKKQLTKRLLSTVLCVVLIFNVLPTVSMFTSAASVDETNYYNRVVDANTMDLWTNYFPVEDNLLSTQNAGGVWTDKSVFTNTDAFPESVTMLDSGKNFLTALSAIAANKEIVGYSTVPTDTVFILDLSNSMSWDDVSDLVESTNEAIAKLQKINNNNRVGVVLYSGTSDSRTYSNSVASLMPIDRYTTSNADGEFIQYESGTVRLSRNHFGTVQVTGSNGAVVSESKAHGGATYIQAGLWEAYKMFEAVDDDEIIIGENNWQKGDYRMPIVVLMSDGAPTLGTSFFADVENSYYGNSSNDRTKANVGNGDDTNITVGQGFLVQLTASYIKNRIENKYKVHDEKGAGRSLFYTLGFNITADNDNNIEAGDIAYNVLNPDATTLTDNLWATYNRLNATNNTMEVRVKGRSRNSNNSFMDVSVTKNSYATTKSYVDEYFSASGTGLSDAFSDIVQEIVLQSRYYPTHLEGGSPDFSGYIEFTDELGEYMEVKNINGILLGEMLYSGQMMASKLNNSNSDGLGSVENPSDLGNEFIRAVQSRLGISNVTDARILVSEAYKAGQISYVTDNSGNVVEWSNYLGWFADASGGYISHWNENPNQAVPENAVYKIKSYGFLGETSGSIKNSDMMYMSVQVKTNIATGKQTVSWKIPASLVPMVTYLVEVNGTSIDTTTDFTLSVENKEVSPIRLVFETGLRFDLNEYNITRITDAQHLADDNHTRIFWNNHFENLDAPSHNEHITTIAEFTPNKENERFYYTFDSAVHKKVGEDYVLVTENEGLNPNGTYYHRRYIFTAASETPIFFYEQMSKASVEAAINNGFVADLESITHNTIGAWAVPSGTPARELDMYDKQKDENLTASAKMVFHPYMTEQNNLVYVDMNLGNNGLLSVTPATGIKVSKTVDIFEVGTSDTFKFRITAAQSGTFEGWITELDATPKGEAAPITLTDGIYEFELKKDQTFWLIGLDAGTVYAIEEISDNDDYKIKSVHVNGTSTGKIAVGTVTNYLIDDIEFVNTAVGKGDLVITKHVVDSNGNNLDVNDNIEFTINVALKNASGTPVYGSFESTNGTLAIAQNGIFTVRLSDGESFVVRGLPEETRYTVTEDAAVGFTLNEAASNLEGVIDSSANDQAVVVNTYVPQTTDGEDITVDVTKTISGNRNTWRENESYTFTLSRLNSSRTTGTVIATEIISYSDAEKKITFSLENEVYTAAGTYYYGIRETVGTQGGITYDTAERIFSVKVADSDMDGDLEVVEVNNETNTVVSGSWTVTANFNNIYAPTGSDSVAINIQKEMNGNHSLAGFQFALYSDGAREDEVSRSNITGADGKAVINLTYAANRATEQGSVYTYYLAEIKGDNPNITYDTTVYTVNVTVKDNGDGSISAEAEIVGVVGDTATFTNTFTPDTSDFVTISGTKVISTNNRVVNANEFEFKIEAHSDTPTAPLPSQNVVRNRADGSFIFPAIEFTQEGEYKYIVSELSENSINGFEYDRTQYLVTVTVVKDAQYNPPALIASVNIDIVGGATGVSDIVFRNEYNPTPATVTLGGTKHLTGKTLEENEFTFALRPLTPAAPMPTENSNVQNKTNGAFKFGTITFTETGTYEYIVNEVNGGDSRYKYDDAVYTVVVVVTDNSEGKLSATYTMLKDGKASNEIIFTNRFTPTPKEYDIYAKFGGEKALLGRPLENGEFAFTLINAISGEKIGESVWNDAAGKFQFPKLSLPKAGIYHFKIIENIGDKKGVSYDNTSYHILLEVEQSVSGELSIIREELHIGRITTEIIGGVGTEVTKYEDISDEKIVFKNTYKADPAYVNLEATKLLTGRELVNGEFKFDLHQTADDYAYDQTTLVQDDVLLTLNDNGSGSVKFKTLMLDTVGTYHYVIIEDEKNENGITPDPTVHKVEITVEDNYDGYLVASLKVNGEAVTDTTAEAIVFHNTYKAAATDIVIKGTKTLNGRDLVADEFSFELYSKDGEKLQTVTNAEDGSFEFEAIPVDREGEYVYTVKEVQGSKDGVTYDDAVYTVTVTVTDNLDGTFKLDYSYNKGNKAINGVEFMNVYTKPVVEIPKTGDNSNLWLWVALAHVCGVFLFGSVLLKKKEKAEEN